MATTSTPMITHDNPLSEPEYLSARNEIIAQIEQIDSRIATLRGYIGDAKARAHSEGVYEDRERFRGWERSLRDSGVLRQRLQHELGRIKRLRHMAEQKERQNPTAASLSTDAEYFVEAARRLLPEARFQMLWDVGQGIKADTEHDIAA